MTFRARLLIAFLAAVLLPLIAIALLIRHEMTDRLTAQYGRRVESLIGVIEEDLAQEGEKIASSLATLRSTVVDDNRFRRAAVDRTEEERRYLLDYAGEAMRLAGLDVLQIQDEHGRIISSGHFRNEYDRLEPALPRLLASIHGGTALIVVRAPDEPFLALARVDSFRMASKRFTIVGGVEVEDRFLTRLARGGEMAVTLVHPGGMLSSGGDLSAGAAMDTADTHAIVRELRVPYIDSGRAGVGEARFRVSHDLAGLEVLRGSIDRWFLFAVAAAVILATVTVSWLASRISRPLVELADKTSRIDLDRLDIDFETDRTDEIGALSRLLGAMTDRLRRSAVRIKDAERRATVGELARQVNHDIKNGLTPIRNVFRHLVQLLKDEPARLPEIFRERQGTLDSSISYLEDLASNYARLYPRSERRPCDVNEIVRRVATDMRAAGDFDIRMNLGPGAVVVGDPVSLRRVLENLVSNACDAVESIPGSITLSTQRIPQSDDQTVIQIAVEDTGSGMSEEQRERIFDDFFTTKEHGSGLGLSIVRRLVIDLGGTIRVESERGAGSRFKIDLPAADPSLLDDESPGGANR